MNNKALKLFELLAGSSFLLAVLGYICGYTIMSSFLNTMFNLPMITGVLFSPLNVILLGYLIIFSFILAIPIAWDFTIKRGFDDILKLIAILLLPMFWSQINFSFQYQKLFIPIWLNKIIFTCILIFIFSTLLLIFEKYIKKRIHLNSLFNYIPIGSLLIIGAILLPIFHSFRVGSFYMEDLQFVYFLTNFYPEFLYTLTFLTLTSYLAIKYIKSTHKKWEKIRIVFTLLVVFMFYLYEFSYIVGDSIAKSYIKNQRGIFPRATLFLKNDIDSIGIKNTDLENVNLLAKDSNNYYIFKVNPNKLYSININEIRYLMLHETIIENINK